MEKTNWHLALRETQSLATQKGVWTGMIAVGLILGVAGPFGTDDALRVVPRIVYWLVVVVLTFFTGNFVGSLLGHIPSIQRQPKWPRFGLVGTAIGICVGSELLALNWIVFGILPATPLQTLIFFVNAVFISIVIVVALETLSRSTDNSKSEVSNTPALLDRLPVDKRARILALTVSDHYVEVSTLKGRELILMRLSDAIRETTPEPGLQIHRSHWVALHAITDARRDGAGAVLTVKDGQEFRVSRTYLSQVKAAGLV